MSKGRAAAYKQTHARILLLSNEGCEGGGLKDEEIGRSLAHFKQVGTATVERVRRRCVERVRRRCVERVRRRCVERVRRRCVERVRRRCVERVRRRCVERVRRRCVERVRRRCVEEGVAAALGRKEQLNRRPKKLDGQGEAHPVSSTGQALIALACGEPPEGRAGWTLKLLADRLVEWEIVASSRPETVRQTLKKTNSSLG